MWVPQHSTYSMNIGTNSVGDEVPMAARKPAKAVPSSDTKRRVTASSKGGHAHWDRQTLYYEVFYKTSRRQCTQIRQGSVPSRKCMTSRSN